MIWGDWNFKTLQFVRKSFEKWIPGHQATVKNRILGKLVY
jgi:hypothetical protein